MQISDMQRKIFLVLPILLLILNIADIVSTYIGLTYYGLIETNPMYGTLMIPVKMIMCISLIILFYKLNGKILISLTSLTLTLNFIYVYTIINNISLLIGAM